MKHAIDAFPHNDLAQVVAEEQRLIQQEREQAKEDFLHGLTKDTFIRYTGESLYEALPQEWKNQLLKAQSDQDPNAGSSVWEAGAKNTLNAGLEIVKKELRNINSGAPSSSVDLTFFSRFRPHKRGGLRGRVQQILDDYRIAQETAPAPPVPVLDYGQLPHREPSDTSEFFEQEEELEDKINLLKEIDLAVYSNSDEKEVGFDFQRKGQDILIRLSLFFSSLKDLEYADWPKDHRYSQSGSTPIFEGHMEGSGLSIIENILNRVNIGKFFVNPDAVVIKQKRLDEAYPGSSAHVFEATMKEGGSGPVLAAKICKFNDLKYLRNFFKEMISLSVASDLGVGPKFYGFTEHNGKPVLLMEKIDGYDVEPQDGSDEASVYINQNSFDSFKKKMSILHDNGLCFSGDNGQYLVGKDGGVFFMDILLSKYEDVNSDQKKEYLGRLADFVYPRVTVETLVNMPKDLVEGLKEVCGDDIIDNLLNLLKEGVEKGLLGGGFQFLQKELRRLDFSGVPKDVIGYRRVDEVMNEILSEIEKSASFISKALSELVDKIMTNIEQGKVPQDRVDEYKEVTKTLRYYSLNIKDIKVLFNNEDWKDYVRASLGDDSGRKKFDDACKVVLAVA